MKYILNESYNLRELKESDVDEIQNVFTNCRDFILLVDGNEPSDDSGKMFLLDVPPGKELEDKFGLGIYKSDKMIGVLDLIKDYKLSGEWYIGLLIINPEERGNGLGTLIHKWIANFVNENNGVKLALGVVANNRKALKFWKSIGYVERDSSETNKSGRDLINLHMELNDN